MDGHKLKSDITGDESSATLTSFTPLTPLSEQPSDNEAKGEISAIVNNNNTDDVKVCS